MKLPWLRVARPSEVPDVVIGGVRHVKVMSSAERASRLVADPDAYFAQVREEAQAIAQQVVSERRITREDRELIQLREQKRLLHVEMNNASDILAEALGYPYDKEYGWITGDHTVTTLAMEARRKIMGDPACVDCEADENRG